tara:strand:- start:3640 stop:4680 length:1041 start_codon:yes stop_codon:yes gene_type:complete
MSFIPLNAEDFVVSSDSITSTLWSNKITTLTNVYISGSGDEILNSIYLPVYAESPTTNPSALPQFSIAYGQVQGSGSAPINASIPGLSPTRVTYGQFRTLINGDENINLNFGVGNTSSPDFYVINVSRANYKEKLFPGTFNLILSGSTTGPLRLTDNSTDSTTLSYCDAGRVFDIISGSNGSATTATPFGGASSGYTVSGSYGKFLPDVGLIILNPQALKLTVAQGGIGLIPGVSNTNNTLNATNVALKDAINKGKNFSLNSEETITSDYMFVRIKNGDFNYTTNPSMISGSGEFYFPSLVNNPQTYITTVGLYNDNNELLGVAKLSKPLVKDFTKEALIRVKLDF